jgi:AAA domain
MTGPVSITDYKVDHVAAHGGNNGSSTASTRVDVVPSSFGKAKSFDLLHCTPPEPMLFGLLDPTQATVLVGDGGVGKGCTASYCIVRLARLGKKSLVVDFEDNEGEWGARTLSQGLDGAARTATMYVSPLSEEWKGSNEGTLWGIKEDLKRIIDEHDIDYIVIDSIIMASGDSKYESPEAARKYKAALTYLGKPSLSLAHVNRAGDHSSPFGSVFWKNLCRTMWSLEWEGNRRVLKHRKHNNYEQAAMQEVSFDWQYGRLVNVTIIPAVQNTIERIQDIITFLGPCTAEAIHKHIKDNLDDGEKAMTLPAIKSILYRGDPGSTQYNKGTPLFTSTKVGGKAVWSNIGP